MKPIKLTLFSMAIACAFTGCNKGDDDTSSGCESNNTTKVTYTNTGSIPLRVQVATQFNAQFEPINPIVTLDLAPGTSVVKEFTADQYYFVWYRDCPTNCTMITGVSSKTYAQCTENEEKQGI